MRWKGSRESALVSRYLKPQLFMERGKTWAVPKSPIICQWVGVWTVPVDQDRVIDSYSVHAFKLAFRYFYQIPGMCSIFMFLSAR
jgi:hypothetical protein